MRTPSLQTIGSWWRKAATALAAAIILGLLAQFAIALAQELGYYDNPSQKVKAVYEFVRLTSIVHWIGGAIIGFALGLWLESAVRTKAPKSTASSLIPSPPRKPDPRIAVVAKAREIATTIRHALENRDIDNANAFYEEFNTEAIDTMETLLRNLGGIPPVTRDTAVSAVYWRPRRREALMLIADDLELLADAVEEKLRGV